MVVPSIDTSCNVTFEVLPAESAPVIWLMKRLNKHKMIQRSRRPGGGWTSFLGLRRCNICNEEELPRVASLDERRISIGNVQLFAFPLKRADIARHDIEPLLNPDRAQIGLREFALVRKIPQLHVIDAAARNFGVRRHAPVKKGVGTKSMLWFAPNPSLV